MPKFKILLHGKGCQILCTEKKCFFWKRTTVRSVGFYTTRFIEQNDAEAAMRDAIDSALEELRGINVAQSLPIIEIEEISVCEDHFQSQLIVRGFSWYFE